MGTHKTLVNGTAFAVTGGTELINGTICKNGGGRTLVNGTAFEVKFSDGLTWIIIDKPAISEFTETIGFSSNGERFTAFQVAPSGLLYAQLIYYKENGGVIKPFRGTAWTLEAYKTVTFDEEPTGTLLRWLQANAVQQ